MSLFGEEEKELGLTVIDQLQEAERQLLEVSAKETVLDGLKKVAITTYNVKRLGCASHRVKYK